MKQTAVDWLIEKLHSHSGHIDILDVASLNKYWEQSKEMDKEQQKQMLIGLLDWMNKVAQDNPMALETDSEDIVDMYLQGYYTKTNVAKNDDGSETHIQVYTRELTLDERAKQHQTPNIFYDIHGSFNIVDSIENSDMTIEDREWLHGKFDEAGIPRNIKI